MTSTCWCVFFIHSTANLFKQQRTLNLTQLHIICSKHSIGSQIIPTVTTNVIQIVSKHWIGQILVLTFQPHQPLHINLVFCNICRDATKCPRRNPFSSESIFCLETRCFNMWCSLFWLIETNFNKYQPPKTFTFALLSFFLILFYMDVKSPNHPFLGIPVSGNTHFEPQSTSHYLRVDTLSSFPFFCVHPYRIWSRQTVEKSGNVKIFRMWKNQQQSWQITKSQTMHFEGQIPQSYHRFALFHCSHIRVIYTKWNQQKMGYHQNDANCINNISPASNTYGRISMLVTSGGVSWPLDEFLGQVAQLQAALRPSRLSKPSASCSSDVVVATDFGRPEM